MRRKYKTQGQGRGPHEPDASPAAPPDPPEAQNQRRHIDLRE